VDGPDIVQGLLDRGYGVPTPQAAPLSLLPRIDLAEVFARRG